VILVNYEAVPRLEEALVEYGFKGVVADETTVFKNWGPAITKSMLYLRKNIEFAVGLSGLPNPESWFDIFPQMVFAHGSFMECTNFFKWRKRYAKQYGYDWIIPVKNMVKIKEAYHACAVTITRAQAGYRIGKVYQRRMVPPTREMVAIQREVARTWEIPGLTDYDDASLDQNDSQTKYSFVITSWLRRMVGGFLPGRRLESNKYEEVKRIINSLPSTERVVIWFAFNDEIRRAGDYLGKHCKGRWEYIDGTVERERRRVRIQNFRQGSTRFLLVQQTCGRFGLDLSSADTVIYFSNSHSNEVRSQSEDRVVMPGKERDALIIDLITEGTVEEEVYATLKDKKSTSRSLLERVCGRFGVAVDRSGPRGDRLGSVERRQAPSQRVRFVLRKSGSQRAMQ
jgi:hypothetical protein